MWLPNFSYNVLIFYFLFNSQAGVAIQYVGNVFILSSRLMVIPLVLITSHACAAETSCTCQNPSEDLNFFPHLPLFMYICNVTRVGLLLFLLYSLQHRYLKQTVSDMCDYYDGICFYFGYACVSCMIA
jgi:hypothetical protein